MVKLFYLHILFLCWFEKNKNTIFANISVCKKITKLVRTFYKHLVSKCEEFLLTVAVFFVSYCFLLDDTRTFRNITGKGLYWCHTLLCQFDKQRLFTHVLQLQYLMSKNCDMKSENHYWRKYLLFRCSFGVFLFT